MSAFDIAPPPIVAPRPPAPKPSAPQTQVASAVVPSVSAVPSASALDPTRPPTVAASAIPSAIATPTAAVAPSSSGATPTSDDRATEFKAVEGGAENRNGTTLMVEAYSVVWLVLMGWIFLLWRKQSTLNVRLDELETAIDRSIERTAGTGPVNVMGAAEKKT